MMGEEGGRVRSRTFTLLSVKRTMISLRIKAEQSLNGELECYRGWGSFFPIWVSSWSGSSARWNTEISE